MYLVSYSKPTLVGFISALYYICAVSSPVVTIIPPTGTLYAGSLLILNCTTQLSSAVDAPVTLTAVWRRNGAPLTSTPNRMIVNPVLLSDSSLYLAQLVFNPVWLSADDGVYACEVNVNAVSEDFVQSTRQTSGDVSLSARGM